MQRLLSGWICIPGVTIATGIAVPGSSPGGAQLADLWVRPPQPLVPVGAIVGALAETSKMEKHNWRTLDTFCQLLFGTGNTLRKVLEHVQDAPAPGTDEEREPGDPDNTVGGNGSDPEGKILQFPSGD